MGLQAEGGPYLPPGGGGRHLDPLHAGIYRLSLVSQPQPAQLLPQPQTWP